MHKLLFLVVPVMLHIENNKIIMAEFKFKITQSSGYSYEHTIRANEKLDAFAKIKAYIKERYASPDLIDYELMDNIIEDDIDD